MRLASSKPTSLWVQAGIILGLGVACVALRAIIPQGNRPWPYWAVFLLGLWLGVMGLFVRYMVTLVPTVVIVSRKGINRNSFAAGPGLHVVFWSWDTVGSGRVESATVGGRRIRVLTLYSFNQEEIGAVGLPLTVSLDALAAEFRARGKSLAR
jgi:hypothetical protein